MKSLGFFEEAAEEIEQERQWYRERSVVAEASFQRELDHAVDSVLESATRATVVAANLIARELPTGSRVRIFDRAVWNDPQSEHVSRAGPRR